MWEVKLKGNTRDLELAKKNFTDGKIQIIKENESWFLRSDALSVIDDKQEMQEATDGIIDYINTSIHILCNLRISIETDGFYKLLEDGSKTLDFLGIGTVSGPMRLTVYDSNAKVPINLYHLWNHDIRVREVFSLFSPNYYDWYSLFKIYETIICDKELPIKGRRIIQKWVGFERDNQFYKTANRNRHSRLGNSYDYSDPSLPTPMSLGQAFNFIREVSVKWLDLKCQLIRSSASSNSNSGSS